MKGFFSLDGPLISFLTKFGQLIIITVLWMVCCIPIITIGPSTSAFYYAVVKTIRHDVGYPTREFFRSFKRTLKDGVIFTLLYLIWAWIAYASVRYLSDNLSNVKTAVLVGYIVLVVLSLGLACYIFPALSRFDVKRMKLFKMALYMTFNRLPATVVLVAVSVVLVWLIIYHLPVACIFFVPGLWCFVSTFLIEPALKKFIPEPEEGQQKQWYDE